MALNYFGATRLTMGLLPSMLDAGTGHIINVATWGVAAGSMPLFTAYHASRPRWARSDAASARRPGVAACTSPRSAIRWSVRR